MKQGWEIKKIKDICDKASSNIAQNKITELDGDYPVFGASGFVQNVDFYHQGTEYIGIVKDGSGVGRVNKYPAYSSLLGTLQYILPKEGYDLNYVAYALKSLNLAEFASGAAIPHIYFKDYGEEAIPVPPRAEQERIVAELDCLSGVIEKKREQLKELDALAQSIFYQMFGDPITNEKGWEIKKLGEVCDVRDGTHDSPKYLECSDYVLITSKNITNDGNIDFSTANYISKEDYESINKRSYVESGDIIMAMIGTIGKPIIVKETDKKFCIKNVALIKFGYSTMGINTYIQALLNNPDYGQYIQSQNKGGTQKFVALGTIRNLTIPLPPIEIQQQFANKINEIEKLKSQLKQSIKDAEELFNSRMNHYFN